MNLRLRLRIVAIICGALVVTGCSLDKPNVPNPFGDFAWDKSKSESYRSSTKGALSLARLSERRGQAEQAEQMYKAVIEREPENPIPHHRLGIMRSRDRNFEQAHEHFQKTFELTPEDPQLLSDVGYCLYLENRLDESEEILRRALERKPNDPAICNNLAIVLGALGRYDECLTLFWRVGPEAEAYANLGFVLAQHGEVQKAKANYNLALTLDPGLLPAAEALAQMVSREERLQRAMAANTTYPTQPASFEQFEHAGQRHEASPAFDPQLPPRETSTARMPTSRRRAAPPREQLPADPPPFGQQYAQHAGQFPGPGQFPAHQPRQQIVYERPPTINVPAYFPDYSPAFSVPAQRLPCYSPHAQPSPPNMAGAAWSIPR